MILIDVIDAERRKIVAAFSPATDQPGPSRRPQGTPEPAPRTSNDPPDYDTSQAEVENLKEEKDVETTARQKQRRLRRYLVWGLVMYLVLSVSIGIPLFVVLRKDARSDALKDQELWMKQVLQPPPPPPDGLPPDVSNLPINLGTPLQCNNWTHVDASESSGPQYRLEYSMPLSSTLYIRSNFSRIDNDADLDSPLSGNLRVSVSSDASRTNATVSVSMSDVGGDALKNSNICLMGNASTWGLSLSFPDEPKYYFDIGLELPQTQMGILRNLVTYLPAFNQSFASLESYRTLELLDVEGSLGSMVFEDVYAQTILVKGSAASIAGNFNATDSVYLETVLQPITANVSLFNGGFGYEPSHLVVGTGRSNVSLDVNLYLQPGIDCRPSYLTSLKTFSGAINANYYHDAAINASTLFVTAENTVKPARIFVDRVFEGTYDIRTTLADAAVQKDIDLIDPSGASRKRFYEDTYVSSNRAYGWAGWGERPFDARILQQGHIDIVSSLSPAVLQLTKTPDPNALSNLSKLNGPDTSL